MRMLLGAALAAMATLGLQAQTAEVKTRTTTKIELNGGRDVTLTGCVARSTDGTTFLLTNVGTTTGGLKTYHLVVDDREPSDARELARHMGRKVEIKGMAIDEGEGKVKTTTKTEVERAGPDRSTTTKGELRGDLDGLPFLGVDEVKMVSESCP